MVVQNKEKTVESKAKKTPVKKSDVAKKVSDKKVVKSALAEKNEVAKNNKPVANETKKQSRVKSNGDKTYATGKRKDAVAKVWIVKGNGNITINGIPASEYLKRPMLEIVINQPFAVTGTQEQFDVICQVLGGGLSGQAGAIRHGIAKALNILNEVAYRGDLKKAGLLTRDPRVVERKKAGLIKARKGQVFKRR